MGSANTQEVHDLVIQSIIMGKIYSASYELEAERTHEYKKIMAEIRGLRRGIKNSIILDKIDSSIDSFTRHGILI